MWKVSGYLLLTILVLPCTATPGETPKSTSSDRLQSSTQIQYVSGSSQKVCQLTGQVDKEFGIPTFSQTESRYGLVGTDNGYSFEYNGRVYFLFGDTPPTAQFNGHPNGQSNPPRITDDNDAIGFVSDSALGPSLQLSFVTDSIGAFKNPVVLDSHGQPAITLRTNETPVSGIEDGGRMYVIFGTDNFLSNPPAGTSSPNGGATRSVLAVSDDSARTFHYLYNFSVAPGAKFIFSAIAVGQDGYIYVWGAMGDTLYRKSAPFLARKPVGGMGDSTAITYFHGLNADGTPIFTAGEASANPIFHDSLPGPGGAMRVADCMGEVGVEWNPFVRSWIMLYNSANNSATNPRGIFMRYAPQPWGPWSPPQTIFNPGRDNGFCYFIHRAVDSTHPACDSLSGTNRLADGGGDYSPYFVPHLTSGDSVQMTSTLCFVLSTWNPYEVVLMKASIQAVSTSAAPPSDPAVPPLFTLEQNYPNPFNPTTGIRVQLSGDREMRLVVYDLLGREVAVLANGRYVAGEHTFTFDGSNVSSGVYFYRLTAGDYTAVRKMILTK